MPAVTATASANTITDRITLIRFSSSRYVPGQSQKSAWDFTMGRLKSEGVVGFLKIAQLSVDIRQNTLKVRAISGIAGSLKRA
jgi:hypothetical protein